MADDYRSRTVYSDSLNLGRLALVFAALAFVFVVVLASAPLKPFFAEWRSVQGHYNRAAQAAGSLPMAIGVKQIWKPELDIADRCITCHIGMGAAGALGEPLFREHPPIPHDPKQYGCTVCHGGQGRATTKDAAHGHVSHWDEQMLERQHLSAGCATCHDQVPSAPTRELSAGLGLIESLDCLSCHKLDGRGRGTAPDLTTVGVRGVPADWHERHLNRHTQRESPEWAANYGPVVPADLAAIGAALRTRVGMPRAVQAWSLALERGCLGCHKVDGRGGDEGPVLDIVGRKPVGDLDFRRVAGPETFTNYMRAHLIDPSGVVPGSQMPALGYSPEEAEVLTTFVLSLRRRDMPLPFTPRERLRRTLATPLTERMSGEQLFAAYCSACHGPRGEGRNFPEMAVRAPRIGSPDFLDLASDEFLTKTLQLGRPGRKMPSLAAAGGALSGEDVAALVAHLRTLPGGVSMAPASRPPAEKGAVPASVPPDLANGRDVYRAVCAGCHGAKGEGKVGPALANPGFQQAATPAFIAATVMRGREGTPMPVFSRNSATYPQLTEADAADVAAFVMTGFD